jgi:hypothetical protein
VLVKVVIAFLLAMLLVAMIGRALFPGLLRLGRAHPARPKICPGCGRFLIGTSRCDCGGRGRRG